MFPGQICIKGVRLVDIQAAIIDSGEAEQTDEDTSRGHSR